MMTVKIMESCLIATVCVASNAKNSASGTGFNKVCVISLAVCVYAPLNDNLGLFVVCR